MLFDLDAVVQHLTDDSDPETVPWTFNADAAGLVPQTNIFGPPRGTTRVWADMTDSRSPRRRLPPSEMPAVWRSSGR